MFETLRSPEAPTLDMLEELRGLLGRLGGQEPVGSVSSDAERVELIGVLESLKGAAAAAQARLTVAFDVSQRAEQAARGMPAHKRGLGIASQVALARRDSPHKGARHLGLARALVREMPHTLAALAEGRVSEWRATLMVRETAVLSVEHRARVDAELGGRLDGLGDRGVVREAKKLAYALDPGSVTRRARRAESERRVSLRPAPETMSYLTGLLPVVQGVAVHAALTKHADTLRAAGDARSRGQIMADTLVERVTGQATATAVPVEVQLVMSHQSLLGGAHTPAQVSGYGPIPAVLARTLLLGSDPDSRPDTGTGTSPRADTDTGTGTSPRADADSGTSPRPVATGAELARVWVRRLYAHPVTGQLVAMESRRREFPAALRKFLVIRDDVCRTPWCDAPIRHADHVQPAAAGGPTTADNGQGLCEACNQAKEAPGWQTTTSRAGPGHAVTVRTPTGHRYSSTAPELPGAAAAVRGRVTGTTPSVLEQQLRRLLVAA